MSLGVSGPLRKGASITEAVRAVIQGAPAISGVVTAGIRLKDALRKGSANWKTTTETNNNNRKKKKNSGHSCLFTNFQMLSDTQDTIKKARFLSAVRSSVI